MHYLHLSLRRERIWISQISRLLRPASRNIFICIQSQKQQSAEKMSPIHLLPPSPEGLDSLRREMLFGGL